LVQIKGLWIGVGAVDEAVDRLLKFLDGTDDVGTAQASRPYSRP